MGVEGVRVHIYEGGIALGGVQPIQAVEGVLLGVLLSSSELEPLFSGKSQRFGRNVAVLARTAGPQKCTRRTTSSLSSLPRNSTSAANPITLMPPQIPDGYTTCSRPHTKDSSGSSPAAMLSTR